MLEKILTNIGLNTNSQLIYLSLIKNGEMSVRIVSQKTGLPRTTVYDALEPLVHLGLVLSKEDNGHSTFAVGDPNTIDLILDEKIASLSKSKQEVGKLIDSLRENTKTIEPKVRFFSGNDGVKKILNDILWYKDIETYTLWPMRQMIDVLGAEYLEWHNNRRIQRNIKLQSLRVSDDMLDFNTYPYLADGQEHLREIRYTPDSIKVDMSYWIYSDKVVFISTGNAIFGFIVHSEEFASMMKQNFRLMWNISKEKHV